MTTTQVYRVYIKATPEAIWTAITSPEWTHRYGYGGYSDYDCARAAPTGRPPTSRCASRPPRRASPFRR